MEEKYYCRICGEQKEVCSERERWMRVCHSCDYWQKRIYARNRQESIRIDGNQYWVRPDTDRAFRGHSGRKFTIQKDNGERIVTRNLWSNDVIPERFRSELPDNAVFV